MLELVPARRPSVRDCAHGPSISCLARAKVGCEGIELLFGDELAEPPEAADRFAQTSRTQPGDRLAGDRSATEDTRGVGDRAVLLADPNELEATAGKLRQLDPSAA